MITYIYDNIFDLGCQIYFFSESRIFTDYTDYADFKRVSVRSGCYLSESGFTGLEGFQDG